MKRAKIIAWLLALIFPTASSFSASEEVVERHVAVPTQLEQWYTTCEQRIDHQIIERAQSFFTDLTSQKQYAIARAIVTKRFEIHEAYMGLCHANLIKELHIIVQLQQEHKALIEQADTKTHNAFKQLDLLLDEYAGVSFQAVNTHITALFWLRNTIQDRWIQLTSMVMKSPDDPIFHELVDGLRIPNLSGITRLIKNIGSLEKRLRNYGIQAPILSQSGIERFRKKIRTIEQAVSDLATKEGWTLTEFYECLRRDYLQSIEMAIINNSIYRTLAKQSKAQSQHKILYPLQIMIAAAQIEDNRDLASRVESYIRPFVEASETVRRMNHELKTAQSSFTQMEEGAMQKLQGADTGQHTDIRSIFQMDSPKVQVLLNKKLKRQILQVIKEAKLLQAEKLFEECCRKKTKKIRTVVRYYFSLLPKEYISVSQKSVHFLPESVQNSLTPCSFVAKTIAEYFNEVANLCSSQPKQLKWWVRNGIHLPLEILDRIHAQISKTGKIPTVLDDGDISYLTDLIKIEWSNISQQDHQKVTAQEPAKKSTKKRNARKKKQRGKRKSKAKQGKHRSKESHLEERPSTETATAEAPQPPISILSQQEYRQVDRDDDEKQISETEPPHQHSKTRKLRKALKLSLGAFIAKMQSILECHLPDTQHQTIGKDHCIHYRRDFSAQSECMTFYLFDSGDKKTRKLSFDVRENLLLKQYDIHGSQWDFYHTFPPLIDELVKKFGHRVEYTDPLLLNNLDIQLNSDEHAVVMRAKIFQGRKDPGCLNIPGFKEQRVRHDGYIVYSINTVTHECFHRQFHPLKP